MIFELTEERKGWEFIVPVTEADKEKFGMVCDEVIDLMRKKWKLSPFQCAYVLEVLEGNLKKTLGQLFEEESISR